METTDTTETVDETPALTDTEAENGETIDATERPEPTLDDYRENVREKEAKRDRLQEQRAEKVADLAVARRALDAQYANEGSAETIAELEARIHRLETSIKGLDGGLLLVDQDLSTARQLVREEEIAAANATYREENAAYGEALSLAIGFIPLFVRDVLTPALDEAEGHGAAARNAWIHERQLQGKTGGISALEVPDYTLRGAEREIVEHLQKYASGMTIEQQNSRMAERLAEFSRRMWQQKREEDQRHHAEALKLMESDPRCREAKRQHANESDGGKRAAYLEALAIVDERNRPGQPYGTSGTYVA
jgi:hypothetical protein